MTEPIQSLFEKETIYNTSVLTQVLKKQIGDEIHTIIFSSLQLSATENDQLQKILQSCHLDDTNSLLLDTSCSWSSLRDYLNIRQVLLFGISESAIQINVVLPYHSVTQFDGRKWIKTYSIQELGGNIEAKKQLWQQALKPLFS